MKHDSNKPHAILVVEDDPGLLRFLVQALKVCGYNTASAESAAAARDVIEHEHIDLALIDIGLPDADGIELGQSLATEHGIPFIHLTGQTENEAIERAARSGAITYLVKPVGIEQLTAAVATALTRATEISKLMRSVEKLSGDFEDKKAVSIAVGIVMERFGLSDGEAFEVLRYAARSHQEKLQTLAERLIAGHGGMELLASLSKYLRKFEPTRKQGDSP
ncbi:MAG: response regulator [Gammaproteobacteria bacterium]|jgi:response regulator NasT|nr:response regulator [Gammaproteobacteria bacterium]